MPVVVKSSGAEQAERFLRNMLTGDIRWDRPLPIPYIGDACKIAASRRFATEEVYLLCDGMRAIAVPDSRA